MESVNYTLAFVHNHIYVNLLYVNPLVYLPLVYINTVDYIHLLSLHPLLSSHHSMFHTVNAEDGTIN